MSRLDPISKTAFDLLRMESGIPEYGVDIDETHLLLDANLSHCYQRQKGCYPGQEVIERILAYGKGRTPVVLKALSVEGEKNIPRDSPVLTPNREVAGKTTSALFDPLDQKTIVLAYLERKILAGSAEGTLKIQDDIVRVLQPD